MEADAPSGGQDATSSRTMTPGRSRILLLRGFLLLTIIAILVAPVAARAVAPRAVAPVYGYEVVAVYPHDREAFTQGLIHRNGYLYEGTGLYGESSLRQVELATGAVLKRHDLDPSLFGEGITMLADTIYQITWRESVGFTYVERDTFETIETFDYPWEGWGLTHDGSRLIASDGSATLRFLDPRTREQLSSIEVRDGGSPVRYLNELEYIAGDIYANVLPTSRIAVIDAASGDVEAWLDLAGLRDSVAYDPDANILNGIAYDASAGRLFVTGKLWPRLFEIRVPLLPPSDVEGQEPWRSKANLRIRPNPCAGDASIEFASRLAAPWTVRVFDAEGALVFTRDGPALVPGVNVIGLAAAGLPNGIYLVELLTADSRATGKFAITR